VVVVVARAPEKTFPFCSAALPLPLNCLSAQATTTLTPARVQVVRLDRVFRGLLNGVQNVCFARISNLL